MIEHDLVRQCATGFGSWDQCKLCGATYYGKLWHLGGYESKYKPPCEYLPTNSEWKKRATKISD